MIYLRVQKHDMLTGLAMHLEYEFSFKYGEIGATHARDFIKTNHVYSQWTNTSTYSEPDFNFERGVLEYLNFGCRTEPKALRDYYNLSHTSRTTKTSRYVVAPILWTRFFLRRLSEMVHHLVS
jgi:hypothetical protein